MLTIITLTATMAISDGGGGASLAPVDALAIAVSITKSASLSACLMTSSDSVACYRRSNSRTVTAASVTVLFVRTVTLLLRDALNSYDEVSSVACMNYMVLLLQVLP
jgi:hypothetical protein